MAEFTYNPIQTVGVNGNVLLDDSIGCGKGYVLHREGSGLVTLRGIVNNPCGRFARYQCTFNANIAVPTGETAGPISLGLAIGGEIIPTSTAIVTPAAVDEYFNVTCTAIVDVPAGCCNNLAVRNASTIPVNVQNANLVITRVA